MNLPNLVCGDKSHIFVGTELSRRADKVLIFVGDKMASTIDLSQLCYCTRYQN